VFGAFNNTIQWTSEFIYPDAGGYTVTAAPPRA
jgi:hypothetical protein